MTILELLQSEETPCHIQGRNTQIIRDWKGDFEVLQTKNKCDGGDYSVKLYLGNIESVAVTAFIAGEKL